MGFKLSKFIKHSYVVSEGVQTDLSIESGPPTYDSSSFVTPPKDVHHICDPRSLTKGIIRTPILCKVDDEMLKEVVFSPVKTKKKPYLETNLDELYYPPDPCDHLLEINSLPLASEIVPEIITDCDEHIQKNMEETADYVIEMPENEKGLDKDDDFEVETGEPAHCMESRSDGEFTFNNESGRRVSHVTDHFEYMIAKSRLANIEPRIDSSETVEQVCQRILNELLHSKADICTDSFTESNRDDLFLDENSDTDGSVESISVNPGRSSRTNLNRKVYVSDENLPSLPPTIGTVASLKSYKDEIESEESLLWSVSSPLKRKPLGEVNRNVDLNARVVSSKLGAGVDESPLKSMLPLLPSHPVVPPAKAHVSKWDREKTLII